MQPRWRFGNTGVVAGGQGVAAARGGRWRVGRGVCVVVVFRVGAGSALDACAAAGDEFFDLGECGHGGVARGGHGEGAVGGAEFDGSLGVGTGHEAVDEAGGEAVAAADAVEDFEVGVGPALVELSVDPGDGAPVVSCGGFGGAEGGGDGLEVGVFPDGALDHALEGGDVEVEEVGVGAFDLEAEAGGKVFLVAEHDVHVAGDLAVDLACACLAADGFPEAGAVIEVVADDDTVLAGFLDGLECECGGGFAEAGEDAAGVEPAHAAPAEDVVPVEVAGLELAGGGVAAVGDAEGGADAEAAFGEVQAVACGAADAVEGAPEDELGADASLEDAIFEETADFVVHEGGADGGAESEAPAEAAGDVVFAAAFPDAEPAGGADPALAGVESEHDFAEGDEVVGALSGRFEVQDAHRSCVGSFVICRGQNVGGRGVGFNCVLPGWGLGRRGVGDLCG